VLHADVTFESDSNFFMGFGENISEGGLFVATHSLREVGSRLTITFELPGSSRTLRVMAEVRWVRLYSESSDSPPGLGLSFVDLAPDDAAAITQFVRQRAPIFYD
jgi:uncharacterized protein (TIGR02266 family)